MWEWGSFGRWRRLCLPARPCVLSLHHTFSTEEFFLLGGGDTETMFVCVFACSFTYMHARKRPHACVYTHVRVCLCVFVCPVGVVSGGGGGSVPYGHLLGGETVVQPTSRMLWLAGSANPNRSRSTALVACAQCLLTQG